MSFNEELSFKKNKKQKYYLAIIAKKEKKKGSMDLENEHFAY